MRLVESVLVDLDDTVWYDRRYFGALRRALLVECKDEVDRRALAKLLDGSVQLSIGECGFVSSIREVARTRLSAAVERIESAIADFQKHPIEILPGARQSLELLTREWPVIAYSAGKQAEQTAKVQRAGLSHLFSKVVVVEKKNPDSLMDVLGQMGMTPERTLMIGNSLVADVQPAVAVGCNVIWLDHDENGNGRSGILPPQAMRANGWEEISELIRRTFEPSHHGGSQ